MNQSTSLAVFGTEVHLDADGLLLSVDAIASIAKSSKAALAKSLAKKFAPLGLPGTDKESLMDLHRDDLRELAVLAVLGRDDPDHPEVARIIKWVNQLDRTAIFEMAMIVSRAKKTPVKAKHCYTYIIKSSATKKIKIGKSGNVKERVSTLQTASSETLDVLAVIPENIETQLHNRFAKYREIGEWFNDSDGVIEKYAKSQARKHKDQTDARGNEPCAIECNTAARRVRSIL